MSFTDGILEKYRCARRPAILPRTSLTYKTAPKRFVSERMDMQRQSRELLRLTKPKLLAEFSRAGMELRAAQRRGEAALSRRLDMDFESAGAELRLELARFSRELERDKSRFLDDLGAERELIVKRAVSLSADEDDREGRDTGEAAVSSALNRLERTFNQRLDETRLELQAHAKKTARKEAEAVFRGFREEEEYQRRRGGGVWR